MQMGQDSIMVPASDAVTSWSQLTTQSPAASAAPIGQSSSPGFFDSFNLSDFLSKGVQAWGAVTIAKSQAELQKAQAKQQAQFPTLFPSGQIPQGFAPSATVRAPYYPPTDKTMLYIGLGVAALAGIMMLTGGRKK